MFKNDFFLSFDQMKLQKWKTVVNHEKAIDMLFLFKKTGSFEQNFKMLWSLNLKIVWQKKMTTDRNRKEREVN